ncbi:probable ubiquitin carboxyl-terminal hydrolase MINDY-4 [Saccostrea echinata]|uniref:probable ubiquitin carboxyl-terminal hydrolase MINDY-4 n=1 Tax=Saccostrea echinata TaxID=191078 RepID=UPI002A812407|nr:probable ubiquitin carboxyl-terminal hydrolase MINDY-4 [Saccostrea echinata]
MDPSYTEAVAASLVREFLSRKGLKCTLQMLDQEMPRGNNSISNRQLLMKELHIEKLMKKNKEMLEPLRTMLEIITQYFLEMTKPSDVPMMSSSQDSRPVSSSQSSRNSDPNDLISPAADRPTSSGYSSAKSKSSVRNGSQDLIIDDDVEGETVLGAGKAGLMDKEDTNDYLPTPQRLQARPVSAKRKGLSGPITSNLEDSGRNRKLNKPRPLTSGSRKILLDPTETTSEPRRTSLNEDRLSGLGVSQGTGSGIGRDRKSSIQDVLDVKETKSTKQKSASGRRQLSVEEDLPGDYSVDKSSIGNRPPTRGSQRLEKSSSSNSLSSKASTKVGDVEFGDCDDLDSDLADLDLGPKLSVGRTVQNLIDARPITLQTAINLKSLIFGSANQCFNDEWKYQGLVFCDLPKLQYGIVQRKGGPCGVLAAIQACVLQELLFGDCKIPLKRFGDPTHEERSLALATALSKIFWRAGEQKTAVLAIGSGKAVFQGGAPKYRADDLTETLMLNHFKSYEDLLSFMTQNVHYFMTDGKGGVILTLYSAIFSRYIDQVREDMDEPTGKLMGAHGYCTQDMVNLYLTGKATSNVFNDKIELDSGTGSDVTVLKGITGRSNIGLLSLFEHYKSCQVGTYLKTPKYPIWVVCSESHFSVLFSIKKELVSDWKAERRFDLYYYDGLARQQEEIKLTIDTVDMGYQTEKSEDDLVPPLELCIRTKWSGANVDWNGSEPLL